MRSLLKVKKRSLNYRKGGFFRSQDVRFGSFVFSGRQRPRAEPTAAQGKKRLRPGKTLCAPAHMDLMGAFTSEVWNKQQRGTNRQPRRNSKKKKKRVPLREVHINSQKCYSYWGDGGPVNLLPSCQETLSNAWQRKTRKGTRRHAKKFLRVNPPVEAPKKKSTTKQKN